MKVVIDLPDSQAEKLASEAGRLGVAPEELVRAAIADFVGRPRRAVDDALRIAREAGEKFRNALRDLAE